MSQKKPAIKNWNKADIDTSREPQSSVTIIVGRSPEAKKFSVHKDIIYYYSPFFDSAFNGQFEEGETQTMTLEDVEHSVFGLLVFWLYVGDMAQREANNEYEYSQTPTQLSKLWILAERFLMPQLQNDVVNELFWTIANAFSDIERHTLLTGETARGLIEPFIQFAYSTESTILQELAADRLAFACSEKVFIDMVEDLPNKAVVAVAKALKTGRESGAEDFYVAEDGMESRYRGS